MKELVSNSSDSSMNGSSYLLCELRLEGYFTFLVIFLEIPDDITHHLSHHVSNHTSEHLNNEFNSSWRPDLL